MPRGRGSDESQVRAPSGAATELRLFSIRKLRAKCIVVTESEVSVFLGLTLRDGPSSQKNITAQEGGP